MKVKELIEKLQEFDGEMEVGIYLEEIYQIQDVLDNEDSVIITV